MTSQPNPNAIHLTPHGFATTCKNIADALATYAGAQGWNTRVVQVNGWYRIVAHSRARGADALRLAREFGRKYHIEVWLWTSKIYDPDNDCGSTTCEEVSA